MKKFSLFLAVMALFHLGWAEVDSLLSEICEQQASEFSAQFQQINRWVQWDEEAEFFGNIFYKNGKIKILYEEPAGQYLLLNDSLFVSYMPQNQQRIERPRAEMASFPLDFSQLLQHFQEMGTVQKIEETNEDWTFSITPHVPEQENLQKMEIVISKKNYMPKELYLIDLESNEVHYFFSSYAFRPIDEAHFEVLE